MFYTKNTSIPLLDHYKIAQHPNRMNYYGDSSRSIKSSPSNRMWNLLLRR